MSERIRSLLARVSADQGSSQSGDAALRERLPAGNLAALERELASEVAYSLGRAGSKLESAFQQALRTRAELDSPQLDAEQRRQLSLRFNEERALAEQRLRYLMIQREALGFRRHQDLLQRYPLPPSLPVG